MDARALPARSVAALVAVAAAVAAGAWLRAADPASSPIIPAEDPYTHMALVREHLRDGHLDPLNPPGALYPPGLHAVVAAAWAFTGVDLYQIVRFIPVLFGAVSVLGIAFLVARGAGLAAGCVAAVAMAVAPEEIFRTTMMSPTALDLAILPFLLYALLRVLQGRMGWLGVAVPAVAFLLLSHPWTLAVLAVAGGVLGVLALAVPWSARRGPPITLAGVAASIALLGSAVGLSLSGCGGLCGPAFRDVVSGGDRLAVLGPWVVAASLAPLALLVAARRTRLASVAWPGHRRSWPARLAAAAILAAMVAATTVVAVRQGMPPMVNLPRMFGWPILAVGALGLLLAPLDPRPVSNAGAALCLATYPLVVFNPLHSPFWSHRTAVFLGLGLVILVGCAAGTVATAVRHRVARSRLASSAGPRLAGASSLLVLALATGGVAAATPAPYAWYRLYSPCEFDGLQDTARRADADPTALVVAGDWQAKLVVAGLADNASRIWFARSFFTSAHDRQSILTSMQGQGRPVYAIVDHHLRDGGAVDASFLDSAPWTPLGTWCAPGAASAPGVRLYVAGVPP